MSTVGPVGTPAVASPQTSSPTRSLETAPNAVPGGGDQPPAAPRTSSSRLSSGWSETAGASSYGEIFGAQSYVKDLSDPNLLALLQAVIQQAPELQGTPLASNVQAGRVTPQDIQALQTFLQSKGYSVGSTGIDGKYGPRTHRALEGFLNGQTPDMRTRGGQAPPYAAPPGDQPTVNPPATQNVQPAQNVEPARQAQTGTQPPPGGPIGPGSRVLVIGDSHTVGTFGTELDRHLRATGAQVETFGSSGSSPSWWQNGTTTRSGFVGRHADGSVDRPADWRTPRATPRLGELMQRTQPDTVIINLGANMRGSSPEAVRRQVQSLAEEAQRNGARVIWVGPPSRQADAADGGRSLEAYNNVLREAVAPYGTFIPSNDLTTYSGSDGVHYNGTQGTAQARRWAQGVYSRIQGG